MHYGEFLLKLTYVSSCLLPSGLSGEEFSCQGRRLKRRQFNPWVGKIPWSRKWQPTPVFLPQKFHGQRSLVGYSPWGNKESLSHTHLVYIVSKQNEWNKCIHAYIPLRWCSLLDSFPDSFSSFTFIKRPFSSSSLSACCKGGVICEGKLNGSK